jgi:hypothetical protein
MSKIQLSLFQLGSLVTINTEFLDEPPGTICLVYEVYYSGGSSGISLITQNGKDLGGFSIDEQRHYLEYYGDTGHVYDFKSVTQLHRDWQNGHFKFFSEYPTTYQHKKP